MVALLLALTMPQNATAHEPGRAECRFYQRMHALVTGSARMAKVAGRRCRLAVKAHALTHPLPLSMIPAVMRRVRECESGGNYRAENRSGSTASGAWQYLDTSWAGTGGYSRAMYAPPRVQDEKAMRDYRRSGTTPWAASRGCWS